MKMPDQRQPAPRRLLVRGVNWLGDAVMTVPALLRLRERYPQCFLALLTTENLAPLWTAQPWLNAVLTIGRGENPLAVGRRLRAHQFDAALVLPGSTRSALEIRAARIPRRLGYGGQWRKWLLTEIVPHRPGEFPLRKKNAREIKSLVRRESSAALAGDATRPAELAHQVYYYLHLAAALGAAAEAVTPALVLPERDLAAVRAKWPALSVTPGEALFHIGVNASSAYGPAKRWPLESYAAVLREVQQREPAVRWVACGTAGDSELCQALSRLSGVPLVNLAGQTNLPELMGVLKICRLLLTNDSGPMHLAAALGTPVVAIFGSTSPALTGPGLPGQTSHRVLHSPVACSPCFLRTCPIDFRCMRAIGAQAVTAAVMELLNRRRAVAST